MLGGATGTSALLAFTAWATAALRPYAPFSWALAALVGALGFAGAYWLIATAKSVWVTATIRKDFHSLKANPINPLDSMFQKQRIKITDLRSPLSDAIENKTFIDCDILGPVIVGLSQSNTGRMTITNSTFHMCTGVIIRTNVSVPFSVTLRDCTFINCKIYGVQFVVPPYMQEFAYDNLPVIWISAGIADGLKDPPNEPPKHLLHPKYS